MLEGLDFEKRFLVEGSKKGFPLFSVGQSIHYESPNLLSARAQPHVVDLKIAKELDAHRLALQVLLRHHLSLFSECPP